MVAVRPSWVFLDRDGTISERPAPHEYVTDPACVRLLPRAAEAVARLNRASIWVGVVTNQQGVALGSLTMETLDAVHSRLRELLAAEGAHLDGIWTCPHLAGECRCRKPQPGLLIAAKDRVPEIDFRRSAMIGDAVSDIAAGNAVGAITVKLGPEIAGATHAAPDLAAAVDLLLSE